MSNAAMADTVLRLLADIAPELDPDEIRPDVNLRDQLDLDSMDFLNFMIAIHQEFGIEIPEADYRKLYTLEGCVEYLRATLHARASDVPDGQNSPG
jgi:acyl carrier protein